MIVKTWTGQRRIFETSIRYFVFDICFDVSERAPLRCFGSLPLATTWRGKGGKQQPRFRVSHKPFTSLGLMVRTLYNWERQDRRKRQFSDGQMRLLKESSLYIVLTEVDLAILSCAGIVVRTLGRHLRLSMREGREFCVRTQTR